MWIKDSMSSFYTFIPFLWQTACLCTYFSQNAMGGPSCITCTVDDLMPWKRQFLVVVSSWMHDFFHIDLPGAPLHSQRKHPNRWAAHDERSAYPDRPRPPPDYHVVTKGTPPKGTGVCRIQKHTNYRPSSIPVHVNYWRKQSFPFLTILEKQNIEIEHVLWILCANI